MTSRIDPAAVAAFWAGVAATPSTFVSDMMEAGGRSTTPEFRHVCDLLYAVHPDLLLVLGGMDATRPEVVISAGGIHEAFEAVTAVTDAAPPAVTDRYDVRAFRPRVGDPTHIRIRVKGHDLGPADIFWAATQDRRDRSRCDLILHVPGIIDALPTESPANQHVAEAVFLLLDHIVGEWAVESQVGIIDWKSDANVDGLEPLLTLPAYLDRIAAE